MATETRPTSLPQWTTGDASQVAAPTPSQIASGFTSGARPSFQNFNWLLWNLSNWARYIDQTVTADAENTTFTAGAALAANVPVYVSPGATDASRTAGAIYPLDVSATSNAIRSQFVGFTSAAVASGATVNVVMGAILGGFTGLTPGAIYYASPTAGAYSVTAPTAASQWVIPVGAALSATQMLVMGGRAAVQVRAFKSVIPMGNFFNGGSGVNAASGVTGFLCANASVSSNYVTLPYKWTAPFAGSVVGISYDYSTSSVFSTGRAYALKNGTSVVDTGSQITSQFQVPFGRGLYAFAAGDVLSAQASVLGSNANGNQLGGSVTLVVEMAP